MLHYRIEHLNGHSTNLASSVSLVLLLPLLLQQLLSQQEEEAGSLLAWVAAEGLAWVDCAHYCHDLAPGAESGVGEGCHLRQPRKEEA